MIPSDDVVAVVFATAVMTFIWLCLKIMGAV